MTDDRFTAADALNAPLVPPRCDGFRPPDFELLDRLLPLQLPGSEIRPQITSVDPISLCGCFQRAYDYVQTLHRLLGSRDSMRKSFGLIHGSIGGRTEYAWVQMTPEIVSDPFTRGLYWTPVFRSMLRLQSWFCYTPAAAAILADRSGHCGPWHQEHGWPLPEQQSLLDEHLTRITEHDLAMLLKDRSR